MTYLAKVGSFNIDTGLSATEEQSITDVGFQPKVVLLWWGGSTASSDTVAGGNIQPGFAVAISSSSRRCIANLSADGSADSSCGGEASTSEVIELYTAKLVTDGIMNFVSMDAGGFTLVVDDAFTLAYRISYLALGGDDLTNVYLGSAVTPTSAGNYNVTDVGFQPDALITFGRTLSAESGTSDHLLGFIGMATASDEQGVICIHGVDAAATSNTKGYGYNGEVIADYDRGVYESFVQFLSNGFTLNHVAGSSARYYYYLALKGGDYLVGDLTTRTDGNDIEEAIGYQPAAILFLSANRALDTQDTPTDHARWSIGAATSASERACAAISDEDNLADTECAYGNSDSAVYYHVADDALQAAMDVKAIAGTGFTCVMDTVEPSGGCWAGYLAFGSVAAAGVPKQAMHYARLRRAA